MTTVFFGERWDVPLLENATQVETPVGVDCLNCSEPVADGDRGLLRGAFINGNPCVVPIHAECDLIGVIGHLMGVCHCTGYDTSSREAARLAWERAQALPRPPRDA